ncbi:hypothetical protein ACQUY5_27965 [Bacillus cereus]|uniref:hypothetical protein n=1 Tax=Bacillus cereus TaxID=1396 RepID=UPI003D184F24
MKQCSLEECNEKHYGKGYCKKHYYTNVYLVNKKSEKCNLEGCNEEQRAKGYCQRHYKYLLKGQEVTLPYKKAITRKTCSIEDCNEKHYAKGLCRNHYNRQWYRNREE